VRGDSGCLQRGRAKAVALAARREDKGVRRCNSVDIYLFGGVMDLKISSKDIESSSPTTIEQLLRTEAETRHPLQTITRNDSKGQEPL
jgi:hypothetical protein